MAGDIDRPDHHLFTAEWRQYEEAFPQLQKSSLDIISLECHNSRVPMDLLELSPAFFSSRYWP
jgi:hypothetical protein